MGGKGRGGRRGERKKGRYRSERGDTNTGSEGDRNHRMESGVVQE